MKETAGYLKEKSVICAAHVILGDDEESLFLSSRAGRTLVIRHPLVRARQYGRNMGSVGLEYESGRLKRTFGFPASPGPEPLLWIKDAIATFVFAYRVRGRFDLFLGTDAFNARLGLCLRRLGKVGRVIYAPTDYIPERFSNKLMNRLYHRIERICCYRADCIWDVSPATQNRRLAAGIDPGRCAPIFVVPNGNHFNDIYRKPISGINRFRLAYVGALNSSKGVEIIIEAMPLILAAVPEAELVIVGGGSSEEALKKLAQEKGAGDRISFTGLLTEQGRIEEILVDAAVGLAPYVPDADGYINFGDPLKVKQYLACGLPVVLTGAPTVAAEIKERRAGIVIEYGAQDLADAVIMLLTDDARYRGIREQAIKMGSDYAFSAIFDKAFTDAESILNPS